MCLWPPSLVVRHPHRSTPAAGRQKMVLLRCFRVDRVYPAASQFIAQCPEMGPKYCTPPILKYLDVYKQSAPHSPIVCIIRCRGKAVVCHASQIGSFILRRVDGGSLFVRWVTLDGNAWKQLMLNNVGVSGPKAFGRRAPARCGVLLRFFYPPPIIPLSFPCRPVCSTPPLPFPHPLSFRSRSPGANPVDEIHALAEKLEVGPARLRAVSLGQGQGEEATRLVEAGVLRGHWGRRPAEGPGGGPVVVWDKTRGMPCDMGIRTVGLKCHLHLFSSEDYGCPAPLGGGTKCRIIQVCCGDIFRPSVDIPEGSPLGRGGVLLQNCHLLIDWMRDLERLLLRRDAKPHPTRRPFHQAESFIHPPLFEYYVGKILVLRLTGTHQFAPLRWEPGAEMEAGWVTKA